MKLYNALFTPHLTYCISVWGGISDYKLSKIFTLQKRCIRLLFGIELTFDHPEYYMTCARARTYTEHTAPKNFVLEHTKPSFNENGYLSLRNLYKYFTLLELFKILNINLQYQLQNYLRSVIRTIKFLFYYQNSILT